jgi:hypothetical protein
MDSSNPYVSPSAIDDPIEESRLWHTSRGNLYIRDGAVLPEVELETGKTADLIQASQKFDQPTVLSHVFLIGVPMMVFCICLYQSDDNRVPWQSLLGLLIFMIAERLILYKLWPDKFYSRIEFKVFRTAALENLRTRSDRHGRISKVTSGMIGFVPMLMRDAFLLGAAFFLISFLGLLSRAYWQRKTKLEIRQAGKVKGVQILHVHPIAIAKLQQIEAAGTNC